jgi:hypothetical protein
MLDPGQSNDPNDPMRDEHLFEEIRLEKSLRHLRTFVSTSLTGLTFALTLLRSSRCSRCSTCCS